MSGWAAGVFTRARNWVTDKAGAVNPQAALFDQEDDNFAGGLNNCVTKDGLNKPSATMDWNTQRLSNLGAATARTDAIQAAQVQDGGPLALAAVAGTDTITGSLTPAITAYANLMRVSFIPANTNTGAATLNVNGVAARSIVDERATALVAGAIVSGVPASVIYDLANTRWVLQTSAKVADAELSSNVPLLNAANSFTANQTIAKASATFSIKSNTATDSALELQTNSTIRGYVIAAGTAGGGVAGSAVGDIVIRAQSGGMLFSGDAGASVMFGLSSAGLVTTPHASAQEVGYQGVPASAAKTADYTVVAADNGGSVRATSLCDEVTIQLASGLPVGGVVMIIANRSGSVTIVQGAGATLYLAGTAFGTTGNRTIADGGIAYVYHYASGNYLVSGTGVS